VQLSAASASWNIIFFENFSNVPTSTSTTGCPSWTPNNSASSQQQVYFASNTGTSVATRCWQCDTANTPSSSTGPNGGVVDANGYADSGVLNTGAAYRYMYCEASSPNYPTVSFAFRVFKPNMGGNTTQSRYKYWYHAYGSAIGTITVTAAQYNSGYSQASISTVDTFTGQRQFAASDDWYERSTTVTYSTTYGVGISFYYVSGTNYTGDIAIDSLQVEAFF